jgi:hypothetical protein
LMSACAKTMPCMNSSQMEALMIILRSIGMKTLI